MASCFELVVPAQPSQPHTDTLGLLFTGLSTRLTQSRCRRRGRPGWAQQCRRLNRAITCQIVAAAAAVVDVLLRRQEQQHVYVAFRAAEHDAAPGEAPGVEHQVSAHVSRTLCVCFCFTLSCPLVHQRVRRCTYLPYPTPAITLCNWNVVDLG